MGKQSSRFLIAGFALSVALHLVLAPFAHPDRTAALGDIQDPLVIDRAPPPPPKPTPTPAPRPTPHPVQTAAASHVQPAIYTLRATARGGTAPAEPPNRYAAGGRPDGVPGGIASAAPVVAATAEPPPSASPAPVPTATLLTCARPNVPAETTHAAQPDMPALAQQQGISGDVAVIVSLDAQSRVVAARVQSSPSTLLNAAALAAARGSVFRTEVRDCTPVAADYVFTVEFASD